MKNANTLTNVTFTLGDMVSTVKGNSLRGNFIGIIVGFTDERVMIRKLTNTGLRPIVGCRIENLKHRKVRLPFHADEIQ